MSIRISPLDSTERDRWDEYVTRSHQGTVFHRHAALEAQASHSNATLHLLAGYKGQQPIGIFPVFEVHKGPITFAFSPPYELHVPNLGPALIASGEMKQRKREKRHQRFVDGCVEWIDTYLEPSYVSIRTSWRYDDPRPFKWNDFDLEPSYTYVIDLDTDEETLLDGFSKSARQNLRKNVDEDYTVEVGGTEAIEWIVRRVNDRYAEQGKTATMTPEFVVDLYERLPDGVVRPYVLSVDGEFATGVILLEHGTTAHSWQGGAKPDVDIPANDLLEWHMMTDAMDRGVTEYEIVDANTPRLNEWKAKFSPDVRSYYTLNRTSFGVSAAVQAYLALRDRTELVTKFGPGRSLSEATSGD